MWDEAEWKKKGGTNKAKLMNWKKGTPTDKLPV